MKFLEENIEGKFQDMCLGNSFLDLKPKEMATKPKINKWESGSRLQSKNILNSPPLIDTTIL